MICLVDKSSGPCDAAGCPNALVLETTVGDTVVRGCALAHWSALADTIVRDGHTVDYTESARWITDLVGEGESRPGGV